MTRISTQIECLREWERPRRATHMSEICPFPLSSTFLDGPASDEELSDFRLDPGLREFWRHARSADLFKDAEFGQWGLRILAPSEARWATDALLSSRPYDILPTDLVVGSFYGDSDLLLMDSAKLGERGAPLLIALPLDARSDWPRAADSFSEFLEALLASEGAKFWERRTH